MRYFIKRKPILSVDHFICSPKVRQVIGFQSIWRTVCWGKQYGEIRVEKFTDSTGHKQLTRTLKEFKRSQSNLGIIIWDCFTQMLAVQTELASKHVWIFAWRSSSVSVQECLLHLEPLELARELHLCSGIITDGKHFVQFNPWCRCTKFWHRNWSGLWVELWCVDTNITLSEIRSLNWVL